MKTQINHLQRGHGRSGISGSNYEMRFQVAEKVKSENPERIRILFHGEEIDLFYHESNSGKTFWYCSKQLHSELVSKLVPYDKRAIEHPTLTRYEIQIDFNMNCDLLHYSRRSEQAQWKYRQPIEIPEKEIEIL